MIGCREGTSPFPDPVDTGALGIRDKFMTGVTEPEERFNCWDTGHVLTRADGVKDDS